MEINKKEMRRVQMHIRNSLSPYEIQEKSHKIFEKICNHPIYQNSECIFSYMNFRSEVDTSWLHNNAFSDKKRLVLPKVLTKDKMEFYEVCDMSQLKKSRMGILEPSDSCLQIKEVNDRTLMIVPGLAFDHHFGRLGYGGGYYDRYLEKYKDKFICCGVAFDCQWVESVPLMPYDHKMDLIVTEDGWIERMDVK